MLRRTHVLVGLGSMAAFGLSCGEANASQVSAGVVARVPLECSVSDFMMRSADDSSVSGVFNEGCNAPGGYDVYAQLPPRAHADDIEAMPFSDMNGVVRIGGANGPSVRQRFVRILFSGAPVTAREIVVSIVPR